MKRVLFFVACQIILFTHFIQGAKISDDEPGQTFVHDLSARIGIRWSVITPPAGFTERGAYHMLAPDDGVAIFQCDNVSYLYLWDGIHWQNFFTSPDGASILPFKMQDIVWFTLPDSIRYRSVLKVFDGADIRTIPTPQANGIRSLFFTNPNNGWAGCEWGQLMHWDGRQWRLAPGFTSYHTEAIFTAGDSLLFAKNDIPAHKSSEYFAYGKKGWRKIQKLVFRNNNEKIIFLQKENYYLSGPDSLFFRRNDSWQSVNLSGIAKDTLVLPITFNPAQLIWASKKGPVRTENFYYLEDQSACNDSDIICIVPMNRSVEAANAKTFYLFSKTGLQKTLHIIAKNYLPVKKNIRFQTNKTLQSGNEAGLCIADFTGDGREDVYAVVTGAANRLYPASEKKAPGSFDEIAEEAGVLGGTFTEGKLFDYDNSASCADIDNDGDQDILVTSLYGPSVLFRQVKNGRFIDHTRTSRLDRDYGRSFLGVWADVDGDGSVDLFVNNSDSASHFYQNNGAGIFRDATVMSGLGGIHSSAAAFGDIDNDGDDDLVCSTGSKIRLFENVSQRSDVRFFEDRSQNLITGPDTLSSISTLFLADLDNDGDLDIFVARVMASNLLFENRNGRFADATEQSGLFGREYSIDAAPLDADNDGALDIFVSNRGSISFYKNLGKLKFRKVRAIDIPKSDGGSVAVGDFQNDGDVDIYTSDNGAYSRTLVNVTNDRHFIKLKLIGGASNRDAIGARVDIYSADSSRRYLGMRTINGGQGNSSASSRIIHIGVPDSAGRNFIIRFPSGRIRHIDHVAAGQFLTVRECDGFAWKVCLLKNRLRRASHYVPLQNDMLFLAAMSVLFVILFIVLRRAFTWTPQTTFLLLGLPIFLLILLFLILHRNSFIYDYLIPASFGVGAWLFGLIITQKLAYRQGGQPEIEDALYFKTAAFFHGEWGASRLNRLALFLANFDADAIADSDVTSRFTANIDDFFALLAPAIDHILRLSSRLPALREQQLATRKTFDNFVADLNDIKVKLVLGEVSDTIYTSYVLEDIALLQQNIKLLRRHVSRHFTTAISESLHNLIGKEKNGLTISLESDCPQNLYGRIRPAEFSQIVDNLIHNAERATKGSLQKKITVECRANIDRIFISFADSGCGVPEKLKDRLFAEQVTSKTRSGGFGLYHASRILARYGGKITLLSTQKNKGTTFLLELKRVDDE